MSALSQLFGKYFLLNQLIFLQSLSGFACATYFLYAKGHTPNSIYRNFKFIYLARAALSLASIYALIFALQHMSVFNALIILNTSPFIIPFMRKFFFGVRIHKLVFPALFVAFYGLTLILSPDRHLIGTPTIVMLISMLALSLSLLVLEHKEHTDRELSIFYYFGFSTAALFIVLAINQQFNIPLHYAPLGFLIGIVFFFTQYFIIKAANYISSQLISVLFYSEIIMSFLLALVMGTAAITPPILIGIGCVVLGGISVTFLEKHAQT